mmetsp:Transcript_3198/g.7447  ORF Transcript_3198/g.7447 Transcript_3198/m.7447 type:complete len:105 (+) Transcript_3198:3-317(+)
MGMGMGMGMSAMGMPQSPYGQAPMGMAATAPQAGSAFGFISPGQTQQPTYDARAGAMAALGGAGFPQGLGMPMGQGLQDGRGAPLGGQPSASDSAFNFVAEGMR